jgi:hypothetical protein
MVILAASKLRVPVVSYRTRRPEMVGVVAEAIEMPVPLKTEKRKGLG